MDGADLWKMMGEVRRSIQRIDDPFEARVQRVVRRGFFGQKIVVGKTRLNRAANEVDRSAWSTSVNRLIALLFLKRMVCVQPIKIFAE